jgi:CRISPR-associated protein Cmr3
VYWLDQLEATPETLRRLVDEGLWSEQALDPQRRAEGFNRIWFAEWASES